MYILGETGYPGQIFLAEEGGRATAHGNICLLNDIACHVIDVRTNARLPLKTEHVSFLTDRTGQLKCWAEHYNQYIGLRNMSLVVIGIKPLLRGTHDRLVTALAA